MREKNLSKPKQKNVLKETMYKFVWQFDINNSKFEFPLLISH